MHHINTFIGEFKKYSASNRLIRVFRHECPTFVFVTMKSFICSVSCVLTWVHVHVY